MNSGVSHFHVCRFYLFPQNTMTEPGQFVPDWVIQKSELAILVMIHGSDGPPWLLVGRVDTQRTIEGRGRTPPRSSTAVVSG